MDLTQLANLGEFIGGVAVLVTLVYLAVQIRQNTLQVRLSTGTAMIANIQNALAPAYDHFETFDRGLIGDSDLSPRDKRFFSALMFRNFHALQNSYYQQVQGSLGDWSVVNVNVVGTLTHQPGGVQWWQENKDKFNRDFRDLIDSIVGSQSQS